MAVTLKSTIIRVLCSSEIEAIKSVKMMIATITKKADSKIRSRTVSLNVFFAIRYVSKHMCKLIEGV